MKIPIPFTKGKSLNISLKSVENFYRITDQTTSGLIGFEGFNKSNQNEQKLIDEGYGSNVTAFAIIKRIADAGADIQKDLIDENNPEEVITEGELYEILQEPGFLQGEVLTQFDYFESLITHLLASGNCYQKGQAPLGFGKEWRRMEILPSGLIYPLVDDRSYRTPIKGYQFNDKNGQPIKFEADQVIQTKYVNPTKHGLNSYEGLSPLQASLYSLTGSNDIQKAIAIMVKHQGARGIITNKGERILDPEEVDNISDRLNADIKGLQNFNNVHATSSDLDYVQIGLSANDLKIIESGVLTDRQLCNAYGVSSRLFNDPANSTFNNVKEANKSMYQNAVLPTLNKILEDINRFWLSQWSLRDNKKYKLILNTSGVEALQSDQKTEAEKDKITIEGVSVVLNMPISDEGKKQLLVDQYGFTEEKADIIVDGSREIMTENNSNRIQINP